MTVNLVKTKTLAHFNPFRNGFLSQRPEIHEIGPKSFLLHLRPGASLV